MYVRVARGEFRPEAYEEMAKRLREAELELAPVISALPGLIDYYAGMDRDSSSMVRVSIWDTREHAEQIGTLPEIVAVRDAFAAAGVCWGPSDTYDVSWWVQSP